MNYLEKKYRGGAAVEHSFEETVQLAIAALQARVLCGLRGQSCCESSPSPGNQRIKQAGCREFGHKCITKRLLLCTVLVSYQAGQVAVFKCH